MPTTSFSNSIANPTGQSMGLVQADGFFSPLVLGKPHSGTTTIYSQGPAILPFGTSQSITVGITAHSGGGQANAVLLTTTVNIVSTVAAAADSVILPSTAVIGQSVSVKNTAATNALAVFPPTGGTINGGAANASVSLAAATSATYYLVAANTWQSI